MGLIVAGFILQVPLGDFSGLSQGVGVVTSTAIGLAGALVAIRLAEASLHTSKAQQSFEEQEGIERAYGEIYSSFQRVIAHATEIDVMASVIYQRHKPNTADVRLIQDSESLTRYEEKLDEGIKNFFLKNMKTIDRVRARLVRPLDDNDIEYKARTISNAFLESKSEIDKLISHLVDENLVEYYLCLTDSLDEQALADNDEEIDVIESAKPISYLKFLESNGQNIDSLCDEYRSIRRHLTELSNSLLAINTSQGGYDILTAWDWGGYWRELCEETRWQLRCLKNCVDKTQKRFGEFEELGEKKELVSRLDDLIVEYDDSKLLTAANLAAIIKEISLLLYTPEFRAALKESLYDAATDEVADIDFGQFYETRRAIHDNYAGSKVFFKTLSRVASPVERFLLHRKVEFDSKTQAPKRQVACRVELKMDSRVACLISLFARLERLPDGVETALADKIPDEKLRTGMFTNDRNPASVRLVSDIADRFRLSDGLSPGLRGIGKKHDIAYSTVIESKMRDAIEWPGTTKVLFRERSETMFKFPLVSWCLTVTENDLAGVESLAHGTLQRKLERSASRGRAAKQKRHVPPFKPRPTNG
ncbi:hypothetical protein S4A8_02778 [Salinisphaera sp. S4-8]